MTSTTTSTESRALTLLGQGLSAEVVASALGVSPSRISQLLSDTEFATQVAELRFANLAAHNERDASYDEVEDTLIGKLKDSIPMMYKPMEVLKAIQVINAAKRRGSSAPQTLQTSQPIVQLIMPNAITQNFTKQELTMNIHNQVVKAGDQELITVQSGNMKNLLNASKTRSLSNETSTRQESHTG